MIRGQQLPGTRWTEQDSLLLQALTFYEANCCTGCGVPMWESMDPDAEDNVVVPPPHRCHYCTAIERAAKPYGENPQIPAPSALRFAGFRNDHRHQPNPMPRRR